jgi:hypothetical protein
MTIKTRAPRAPRASVRHLFTLLLGAFILHLPATLSAADTICARVKIEIKQELTLERQGFDAMRNNMGTEPNGTTLTKPPHAALVV